MRVIVMVLALLCAFASDSEAQRTYNREYIPSSWEGWYYYLQGDKVFMLQADNADIIRRSVGQMRWGRIKDLLRIGPRGEYGFYDQGRKILVMDQNRRPLNKTGKVMIVVGAGLMGAAGAAFYKDNPRAGLVAGGLGAVLAALGNRQRQKVQPVERLAPTSAPPAVQTTPPPQPPPKPQQPIGPPEPHLEDVPREPAPTNKPVATSSSPAPAPSPAPTQGAGCKAGEFQMSNLLGVPVEVVETYVGATAPTNTYPLAPGESKCFPWSLNHNWSAYAFASVTNPTRTTIKNERVLVAICGVYPTPQYFIRTRCE